MPWEGEDRAKVSWVLLDKGGTWVAEETQETEEADEAEEIAEAEEAKEVKAPRRQRRCGCLLVWKRKWYSLEKSRRRSTAGLVEEDVGEEA